MMNRIKTLLLAAALVFSVPAYSEKPSAEEIANLYRLVCDVGKNDAQAAMSARQLGLDKEITKAIIDKKYSKEVLETGEIILLVRQQSERIVDLAYTRPIVNTDEARKEVIAAFVKEVDEYCKAILKLNPM